MNIEHLKLINKFLRNGFVSNLLQISNITIHFTVIQFLLTYN